MFAAAFGTIDAIAVANIETTLAAVPPDRVLDEPGKGAWKDRVELPGIDPVRDGCNKGGASCSPFAAKTQLAAHQGSSSSRCGDCCPGGEEGGG
jgi:hypothetical protein